MDAVDEFLFGADANLSQHGACHLAEEIFHQVQPGAVLGNEDEPKALWPCRQAPVRCAPNGCPE